MLELGLLRPLTRCTFRACGPGCPCHRAHVVAREERSRRAEAEAGIGHLILDLNHLLGWAWRQVVGMGKVKVW